MKYKAIKALVIARQWANKDENSNKISNILGGLAILGLVDFILILVG